MVALGSAARLLCRAVHRSGSPGVRIRYRGLIMRSSHSVGHTWKQLIVGALVFSLLAGAILMVFLYAPTEATMGHAQRILYLHVSVTWCGLVGCLAMGACSAAYMIRRN